MRITTGRRRAEKGSCQLALDDIAAHQQGLIAAVVLRNALPDEATPAVGVRASADLATYRDIFGDRCYGLAELHLGPCDSTWLDQMFDAMARSLDDASKKLGR